MPADSEEVTRPAHGGEHQPATEAPPLRRKLVLFADGTGAAFTKKESNVWRLYEALDRTRPDQVAYYIKGVGTAGWAPLAALDGATGIGVPSNARKLYRFLCWNWQPGDEIYMFGFSRGSFTARTLAALIASQGLVPATIDGVPVSHAEMQRNAMAAWREYRRGSIPWYKSLPTIWISRLIRDVVLAIYHFIMRHRSYSDVRKAMDGRADVKIDFLGVFDTVEAFGVPVEELRTAIDWAIWPISFRNRRLSDKVVRARHALSLDDERTTFHPLRFDQSQPRDSEQIREVWFAGVHSDVGGGYPDGTLSYVPLVWMAEQVQHDLRFQPGTIEHFKAYQSAIGPLHDSRSGAAVMYRYGPRPIGDEAADGGPPVVHLSVVERMVHGCDNYVPVMLPASAKVRIQSGQLMALTEDRTRQAMKSAYQRTERGQAAPTADADAFTAMKPPDGEMSKLALDTVWWRRFSYFALLGLIALLVAWPWVARKIVALLSGPADAVDVGGNSALTIVTMIDNGVGAVIGSTANLLAGVLPSYAAPWLNIAAYYPFMTTLVVLLTVGAWQMNGYLRDRILERARLAWDRPNRMVTDIGKPSVLLKIGRFMRLHGRPAQMAFARVVVPGIFLIAIFGLGLLAVSRNHFNWRAGTGAFCEGSPSPVPAGDRPREARELFNTRDFCWASGQSVEKGRKYRVFISMADPWFDRTVMSGANGFTNYETKYLLALPIRRLYAAAWFQPVARIGKDGSINLPLTAVNVMPPDELPRLKPDKSPRPVRAEDADASLNGSFGTFEPIPSSLLGAANTVWQQQELATSMVAEFVAPESGELFFYVNDAVQVLPFLGPYRKFYDNNSGSAHVHVQRLPPPALP